MHLFRKHRLPARVETRFDPPSISEDDKDMSVRYKMMKKSTPIRFCMPPVSCPLFQKMNPRATDAPAVDRKCSVNKNG